MTVCLTMLNKCNKCSLNQNKYNFLNSNQRMFSIVLLDDNVIEVSTDVKSTIGDLFHKVCDKLKLKEYDIFGLAQKIKNEYHIIPHDEKINKYLNSIKRNNTNTNANNNNLKTSTVINNPSELNSNSNSNHFNLGHNSTVQNSLISKITSSNVNNSSSNTTNEYVNNSITNNVGNQRCDSVSYSSMSISTKSFTQTSMSEMSEFECSCSSITDQSLKLYFRVKFYVTDPLLLRDPQTRHLYYLQLRNNYLTINHKLNDEKYFMLAALALVVDYGPFNKQIHTNKYFDLNSYFPNWIINKLGQKFIFENMIRLHEQESRYSSINAQNKFCIELSNDEYPFNFHLYNVYKNKEETPGTISLGIAPKGILVFELRDQSEISLISTFNWSSVAKLNSEKKKFEVLIDIESKLRKYTYYTNCEKFSKYLLDLSKITHAFTVNIFARLADQKSLTNYVSESCAEKVLEYSENQIEFYEEREIRDKSMLNDNNEKNKKEKRDELKKVDSGIESDRVILNDPDSEPNLPKMAKLDLKSSDTASTCSYSTSSLSNYETVLGVNNLIEENFSLNNDSINSAINSNQETTSNDIKSLKKRVELFFESDGSENGLNVVNKTNNSNDDNEHEYKNLNYLDLNNYLIESESNNPNNVSYETTISSNKYDNQQANINKRENKVFTNQIYNSLPLFETNLISNRFQNQNVANLFLNGSSFNNLQSKQTFDSSQISNNQNNLKSNYLNYRQTFAAQTTTSSPINQSLFSNNLKLKPNRSVLPPPPPLPEMSNLDQSFFSQIMSPNKSIEYLSDSSLDDIYQININHNSKESLNQTDSKESFPAPISIRNEFHYNLSKSNLLSLRNSDNVLESTNLKAVSNILPSYQTYKKPPSYEESIKKLKKHSINSSSSSLYNEDSDSSKSSFQNDSNKTINAANVDSSMKNKNNNFIVTDCDDDSQIESEVINHNIETASTQDTQVDLKLESNTKQNVNNQIQVTDNTIDLSIENLEEIRMKAASMSLPLLTALCSDQSIIRSLSKNKREGSF